MKHLEMLGKMSVRADLSLKGETVETIKRFVFMLGHEDTGRQTVAHTQPGREKRLPSPILISEQMKNLFQTNCFLSLGQVGNSPSVCAEAWKVHLFCWWRGVHPPSPAKTQPSLLSALTPGPRAACSSGLGAVGTGRVDERGGFPTGGPHALQK